MWMVIVMMVFGCYSRGGLPQGRWVVPDRTYRVYSCIIGCKDTHYYHMMQVW